MITKTIRPIIGKDTVVGTRVEYRVFGILVYEKTLYMPNKYGVSTECEYFTEI